MENSKTIKNAKPTIQDTAIEHTMALYIALDFTKLEYYAAEKYTYIEDEMSASFVSSFTEAAHSQPNTIMNDCSIQIVCIFLLPNKE